MNVNMHSVFCFVIYHWRKLPQVSFLSQQKFCPDKHAFVMTKHIFCRDKSMLVVTKLIMLVVTKLSFVMTDICQDKHNFCCNKSFVTSLLLSQQKTSFVVTKVCLS